MSVADHVAFQLDLARYENNDGPRITALDGHSIRVAGLPEDKRFPHFALGAADRRILSVLSTAIHHDAEVIGTLNIFSRNVEAFADEHVRIAELVAAEAAIAIARSEFLTSARSICEQLQAEFDERSLTSRAEGVLKAVDEYSASQSLRSAPERRTAQSGEDHVDGRPNPRVTRYRRPDGQPTDTDERHRRMTPTTDGGWLRTGATGRRPLRMA